MLLYSNGEEIELRKWQKASVVRSRRPVQGIFLEALGGRGKTIGALAICQEKKAKRVLVMNDKTVILDGWRNDCENIDLGYPVYYEFRTDKWLRFKAEAINEIKGKLSALRKKIGVHKLYRKNEEYVELFDTLKEMEQELVFDVLIIDEWQNMCSSITSRNYKLIKRDYTIGLSATPIRQKGENFYPLEKVFFNSPEPSSRNEWRVKWGKLRYDDYSATKTRWEDFMDYEAYIEQLDSRCNFMCGEEIEFIEQAEENNGFKKKTYPYRVKIPKSNLEKLKDFRTYNVLEVDGKYIMGKGSMSNKHIERYLKQAEIKYDFPKVMVDPTKTSPVMDCVKGLLDRSFSRSEGLVGGVLVACESKQVAIAMYELFKGNSLGLWAGKKQIDNLTCANLIATTKSIREGVDKLQYRFDTLVVLDPKPRESGEYNDYRQLQWRISGARQQHNVNIIEFIYVEE
jgi:hypothetical protein